ncbi:unnamed protein product [Dovyalis caffra]|uniref:Peptidase S54 rhomboid domain-containing protein n=1 Tax=Dovyalis caffra TaxID=77055 RepID=A0AAV1QRT8_9ROSI|nr:unnamed protein product [Dovyalis caffra]
MRRLLSLRHASSNLSKKLTNNSSLLLSHPCKIFTKPTNQYQNHILSSPLIIHSCQSCHNLSPKIPPRFLSKQFLSILSNTHFRVSTKSLTDCKAAIFIHRFARGYSWSDPKLGFYRRCWSSWFNQLPADNVIARIFGPEFLLKLYLAGAIGGSVFYLLHHGFMALSLKGQGMWVRDPSRTPGLGASGAVNAIMLLDIFLNPRATLYFNFIIPVPAILLGIFLIGKDMLRILEGNSNISGSAHLGVLQLQLWHSIQWTNLSSWVELAIIIDVGKSSPQFLVS